MVSDIIRRKDFVYLFLCPLGLALPSHTSWDLCRWQLAAWRKGGMS